MTFSGSVSAKSGCGFRRSGACRETPAKPTGCDQLRAYSTRALQGVLTCLPRPPPFPSRALLRKPASAARCVYGAKSITELSPVSIANPWLSWRSEKILFQQSRKFLFVSGMSAG